MNSRTGEFISNSTQDVRVPPSSYFSALAVRYVDEAIAQCGDDSPPICVLQAAILVTHWLLIQGVRGRAWRSLGLCIRLAYEMGLHSTDAYKVLDKGKLDPEQWCQDEERRRAWWAIWEMDVFASVLYRVPCTINWSYTQVWLPADDDKWLGGQPHGSCFLQRGLISRCKDLQKSGNESPKAWFIVLNSLMAEAHILSCRGNSARSFQDLSVDMLGGEEHPKDSSTFLETLLNAIQLCAMSVPTRWKYRGQFLDFDALPHHAQNQDRSTIHEHSSIYEIALMQEVARLMTLKNSVFEGGARRLLRVVEDVGRDSVQGLGTTSLRGSSMDQKLEKYFHASDAILNILVNSSETHIRFVNPFIAHAAWMAAAVQMLRLELTRGEAQRELARSKFEILKTTHCQFAEYWSMSQVPQQNLDVLAVQLKRLIRLSSTPLEGSFSSVAATVTTPPCQLSRCGERVQEDGSIVRRVGNEARNGTEHAQNPALNPGIAEPESATSASYNDCASTVSSDLRSRSQISADEGPRIHIKTTAQTLPGTAIAEPDGSEFASASGICMTSSSAVACDHGQAFPIPMTPSNLTTMAASASSDLYIQQSMDIESLNWFGFPTDKAIMTGDISNYLDEIFSGAYSS